MNISKKSVLFTLQVVVLFLFSFSCQPKVERHFANSAETIRYLALGDSYTIGTGIETENSWPRQLSDSLEAQGFFIDTTHIFATNGWTTADLKNGIASQKPDSNYNLVSLLIGVNNQYQGLELTMYRTDFRLLLEQAIAFASGDTSRVFVVSIPNYGVTPFAQTRNPVMIRQEIDVYNDIAGDICNEYEIPFVNITPISELASEDTTLLAPDNLHPSAEMYAMWIEEMLPSVIRLIQE